MRDVVLKAILGAALLAILAFIRFIAVYGGGGMSLADDWTDGTLKFHLFCGLFLFVFWMIFGPNKVEVPGTLQDSDPTTIGGSTPSGPPATGSGGSDADGGGDGDGD